MALTNRETALLKSIAAGRVGKIEANKLKKLFKKAGAETEADKNSLQNETIFSFGTNRASVFADTNTSKQKKNSSNNRVTHDCRVLAKALLENLNNPNPSND